jgi:hypothetical protein
MHGFRVLSQCVYLALRGRNGRKWRSDKVLRQMAFISIVELPEAGRLSSGVATVTRTEGTALLKKVSDGS